MNQKALYPLRTTDGSSTSGLEKRESESEVCSIQAGCGFGVAPQTITGNQI